MPTQMNTKDVYPLSYTPDMPDEISVATETELLDFVNRARRAGGANILGALLPSQPQEPESCLIANGLNFGCVVDGADFDDPATGEPRWNMTFPDNIDREVAQSVADALGCELLNYMDGARCLVLPREIGHAAGAFDARIAFQNYVEKEA